MTDLRHESHDMRAKALPQTENCSQHEQGDSVNELILSYRIRDWSHCSGEGFK